MTIKDSPLPKRITDFQPIRYQTEFSIQNTALKAHPLGAKLQIKAKTLHGDNFEGTIRFSDLSELEILQKTDLNKRGIRGMRFTDEDPKKEIAPWWALDHADELQPDSVLKEQHDNAVNIFNSEKNPKYAFIERPSQTADPKLEYKYFDALALWLKDNMNSIGCETIEAIAYKFGKKEGEMYSILKWLGFEEVPLDDQGIEPRLIREYGDDAQVAVLMRYTGKK
ncbi:hypothetical protein M1328_00485 [Patescibacteria group bacterium]|nr:hypothetical protein [Patescibacteria group bacterium]